MSCGWFILRCKSCYKTHLINFDTMVKVAEKHGIEVDRDLEKLKGYNILIECPNEKGCKEYYTEELRFVVGDLSDTIRCKEIKENQIEIRKK